MAWSQWSAAHSSVAYGVLHERPSSTQRSMDSWCNDCRLAVLRRHCSNFFDRGVYMSTFCNECGRYQGHEPTCSQSEQVTIDELSHENSLVRARNERLEADRTYLITVLTDVRDNLQGDEWHDVLNIKRRLDGIILVITGSAT